MAHLWPDCDTATQRRIDLLSVRGSVNRTLQLQHHVRLMSVVCCMRCSGGGAGAGCQSPKFKGIFCLQNYIKSMQERTWRIWKISTNSSTLGRFHCKNIRNVIYPFVPCISDVMENFGFSHRTLFRWSILHLVWIYFPKRLVKFPIKWFLKHHPIARETRFFDFWLWSDFTL